MSKIGNLTDFLKGSHVMRVDGLTVYHDAKKALKCVYGKRTLQQRVGIVKTALKNYRVMVSLSAETNTESEAVRVYRPDTGKEFFI